VTVLATLVATLLSIAALAYLAATDAKRRRVFGLAPFQGRRYVWPALALTVLPGPALLVFGNSAGFIAWLGAITVAGWGVAALTPAQATRLRAGARSAAGRFGRGLSIAVALSRSRATTFGSRLVAIGQMPVRIAALEARVVALEAKLEHAGAWRERPRLVQTSGEEENTPHPGADEPSEQGAAVRRPSLAP